MAPLNPVIFSIVILKPLLKKQTEKYNTLIRIPLIFLFYRYIILLENMQEQSILGRLLMKITDVRIRKITDDEKMKAVVSITIDNEFVVHDIKIINGSNGEFIAMPNKRLGNGDFRDIAHPLTAKTREKICDAIFEEYHRVFEEQESDHRFEESLLQEDEK